MQMKSAKMFVLFLFLPVVTVETGVFDFFNVFNDKDVLRSVDSKDFEKDLRKSLYGQHIALETVLRTVTWFMRHPDPPKPLVLSLHGPTGVGKTHVTRIIARNIYEMGENSKHVHTFTLNNFSPQTAQSASIQLKQWINGNVSSFPHSMFIFEGVDQTSSLLIETMKPFLGYKSNVNGVSFRKAIFIFISNSGQKEIIDLALDFWRKGKDRKDIQMSIKQMESQIYQDSFNYEDSIYYTCGLWHSSLTDDHPVDHFVPFLPLEMEHVRWCVLAEMVKLTNSFDPDLAHTVAKEMSYFPSEEKIFSVKGCKTVKQKLVQYIHRLS